VSELWLNSESYDDERSLELEHTEWGPLWGSFSVLITEAVIRLLRFLLLHLISVDLITSPASSKSLSDALETSGEYRQRFVSTSDSLTACGSSLSIASWTASPRLLISMGVCEVILLILKLGRLVVSGLAFSKCKNSLALKPPAGLDVEMY